MDFLTFKSFISTEVLIIFYYIGAIIVPVGTWVFLIRLMHKFRILNKIYENREEIIWKLLNVKQKTKFLSFFVSIFIFVELFWRMLFEFLIAYMQIRDALLQA